MKHDLLQRVRAIAVRLELGRGDVVTRAWAEQDLRALCCRSAAAGLRSACLAMLRACARMLGSTRPAVRLHSPFDGRKRPAMR